MAARPVRQASVLNLIVFKGGDFLAVVMVAIVLCFLHTLDHFFGFDAVAKDLQQIDDLHILVGGIFQSIVHPAVGFAAHIDEQVAVGNFNNIISSWLIAVQVNAVVQQHGQLVVFRLIAQHLAHPVVFREDRGDDLERFLRRFLGCRFGIYVRICGCIWLRFGICIVVYLLGRAAGKNACQHQKRQKQRKNLFHKINTSGL